MSAIVTIAMAALTAQDVPPDRFYVDGIQQGMSFADYSSMISNGGFKSGPIAPDRYWATIYNQNYYVTFCKGMIVRAVAEYRSSDWIASMKNLTDIGFKFSGPFLDVGTDELRSSKLIFATISPKGYSFFITPLVNGMVLNGKELGAFQLVFEAVDNPCR